MARPDEPTESFAESEEYGSGAGCKVLRRKSIAITSNEIFFAPTKQPPKTNDNKRSKNTAA